ncbi:MAG TPA: hypothetical protein VN026_10405 [Bacteroidia bacterium]|jgi:hypothetical protein|nr:hypothetical protein [Bacteroidia bacterium]
MDSSEEKEIKKINYYLKQIDGNLFIISEHEKPERENYIVNDNNALVTEKYFKDLKEWETSRNIYECNKAQIGEFLSLATKEGGSLSDLNENLEEGILMPDDRIEIKELDGKQYAFII